MIIGTAGHIDHGKTALVRALTGVDTDRLPEEKRRGITIALGFAPLELSGVGTVGVVDVPGHEAFVRTMLAGASGIDVALLVIAADEGLMPQTREHLEILTLLGVERAVVALTKADLVDDELIALVADETRGALSGRAFADARVLPVSARTGAGMKELRAELARVLSMAPERDTSDLWRMPVDRVFSVAGAGTVVTGTTWSGAIAVGENLRILPLDRAARVRSLERHGGPVPSASAGARLAIALAGVERSEVAHDAVLVRDGEPWTATRQLRADVALLDTAATVGVRTRVRFHLGTAEVGARIVATGGPLAAGAIRTVRVVLDAPLVLRANDRFVLRGGTPHTTIGGGLVTDPSPAGARPRPWPHPAADVMQRLRWLLEEAGPTGLEVRTLPIRLGVRPNEVDRIVRAVGGSTEMAGALIASSVLEALRARLVAVVSAVHESDPLAPGLDRQLARAALRAPTPVADEVIRRAERAGVLEAEGSWLRRPGWRAGRSAVASDRRSQLLALLDAAGAEPPTITELTASFGADALALLKLLEADRAVVAIASDRWFATSAIRGLLAKLRGAVVADRRYSPSVLREILGISRKYLIPFLEWTDRRQISHRSEEGRSFRAIPENP